MYIAKTPQSVTLEGMEEELLTPQEAAKFLKIHIGSVLRLCRQGTLPGVKIGGGWRIPRSGLQAMLTTKKPAASEGQAPDPGRTGTAGD
jgi:excisionase family DNA binding protein